MYQDFSQEFGATKKYMEMMGYLQNSFEIILICSKKGNLLGVKKIYEVPIIPPRKKDLKSKKIISIFLNYFIFYIYQIIIITKVLLENKDINFAHIRHDTYSVPSTIVLSMYGKKIVADGKIFSSYALKFDKRLRITEKILVPLEKLVLTRYWKFYVYSYNYRTELIKYGLSDNKLFYIPSSIDLNKIPFYPLNDRNLYNICYFGSLYDYSNVGVLIKAFYLVKKSFPQSLLYIIGDGECYNELKEMVKEFSLEESVIFTGHLHTAELYTYFDKFSLMVNPTKLFAGALPTKRIEAAAAGKVIFEANSEENTENDESEEGIIYFDATDPLQLSDKICCLFESPYLIYQYSKRSRQFSKKYDITNYEKLVNTIKKGGNL